MKPTDLQTALEALAAAHGPSALADAFRTTQRMVQQKRRKQKQVFGPLATAVMECIQLRDKMKADGVTGDDLNRGLEGVLRDMWPKPHGRTAPWRLLCEKCNDYGYEYFQCPGDHTCGPNPAKHEDRKPHAPHEFVRPCFCAKGRTMLEKREHTPDDATTQAAKPKKMTRWGR